MAHRRPLKHPSSIRVHLTSHLSRVISRCIAYLVDGSVECVGGRPHILARAPSSPPSLGTCQAPAYVSYKDGTVAHARPMPSGSQSTRYGHKWVRRVDFHEHIDVGGGLLDGCSYLSGTCPWTQRGTRGPGCLRWCSVKAPVQWVNATDITPPCPHVTCVSLRMCYRGRGARRPTLVLSGDEYPLPRQ